MSTAQGQRSAKVLVAMSGGVDSSVAAQLLVEAGLEATGVTMKLFSNDILPPGEESTCCSLDDVEDARAICRSLGIPHYTLNFGERFAEHVIDHFCSEYLSGHTPNPCIDCNRYLKFAALQQRRRELGADYVATGHYARRLFDQHTGMWQLACGLDRHKDQSYVLYHLTQDDLEHMLFPLGDLTKSEVRSLAERCGYVNADKAESQDICFVPDGDHVGFIARSVEGDSVAFKSGDIVDRSGKVIGEHQGLIHYTIGQRKGIGIAAAEPLYVYGKDVDGNRLIVGVSDELLVDTVAAEDINLISVSHIDGEVPVQVKTHYRQKPVEGFARQVGDARIEVRYATPQRISSPGQALVLYDGDIVVGGGTIV